MTTRTKTKRYMSEDGCYLHIDERQDGFYIAWYIPEDGDFGGYIGEHEVRASEAPKKKEDWESWIAHKAIKPFADTKTDRGFCFETIKKARLALAAANEALLNGGAPWPPWAIQARDAGWKPPKGWKP